MNPLKHPLQTKRDQERDEKARARGRRAQARYKKTPKGKATESRYSCSPAHRAAVARYRSTEKGRQAHAKNNARRIFVGEDYCGRAQTIEQATDIQVHIKERVREFKQRFQNREEAEGVSSGAVSTQAAV